MISFQDLRKIRPWLTATFVTFLGYVAVGWPSVLWLHHVATRQDASASTALAVPWLATGVAVACLMHFGIRAWPAVFAGSMAVWGVIEHGTLPLTLGESVSEALSAVLIVWLLRAWEFHPALDRYKDSLLLIAAVCVGRMASAAFDALSVIATAAYASDPGVIAYLRSVGAVRTGHVLMINIDLLRFTGRWWLNTVAGCLLVVPLLALRTRRLAPRREHPRLALATLSSVAALWLTAALVLPPGPLLPMLLLGALLLAVWAAVQFGVGVAAAITLLLALSSRIGFGLQLGAFGGLNPGERVEVAWGFIGLLSGTALFLTALLSQREQARREIASSAERYQRLFIGNPFSMWIEDAVSGRILLANPAALRTYGYEQAQFPLLCGNDLRNDSGVQPSWRTRDDGSTITTERHRTALGMDLDVEVTRAGMAFGGAPVRICFVEPQSERNELRLAVLTAGDLERFRLGGVLQNELMPLLAGVVQHASELGASKFMRERSDQGLLHAIKTEVGAAARICKQLTRGASPLQHVQGDLIAALRRLPESLPGITPAVQVSVQSGAPLALSIERRDHIYRLAEEAVRSAAARSGSKNVRILLDIGPASVRMQVEDDSDTATLPARGEDLANRSIAARAVAAGGQLRIAHGRVAGTTITFECEQESQGDPKTALRAVRTEADERSPANPEEVEHSAAADVATTTARRWLPRAVLLALAYSARRYGHTMAEFGEMSLSSLDADSDHPIPILNWRGPSRVTMHHRIKTGEVTDVELSFMPVEIDGQPEGLCFAIDVSERNRLRTRLIEATDWERRNLARELHDGLGQILTGLQLGTVPMMRSVQHGEPLDRASVKFVANAAQEALRTCEQILRGVSPLQEVGGDLLEAIRRLAARLPPDARDRFKATIVEKSAVVLPLEEREHLYQIAQEAVTNSLKHAHANHISVTVAVSSSAIELSVADDGVGFDPARRSGGLGLDSLALRAAALGARLTIGRHGASGTIVRCLCPQELPENQGVPHMVAARAGV